MHRFAPLLLATSGCAAAFSVEVQDLPVNACGPYGTPQPVVFEGLDAPIDLSLDASATHGFVRVDRQEMDLTIVPIVLDTASGAYVEDPARAQGLAMLQSVQHLHYAHITAAPNHPVNGAMADPRVQADMFASLRPSTSNLYSLYHYHFTTAQPPGWALAENQPIDTAPNTSVYPGNELELDTGVLNLFLRYATVVRIDQETLVQTLDLDELPLPSGSVPAKWQVQMVAGEPVTAQINKFHVVDAAVLALGTIAADADNPQRHPLTLIYSGRPTTTPDAAAQLFFTYKHGDGTFPAGTRVEIAISDGDFVEPWTTPDCLTLWFRRGDTIYRADTL